MRPLLPIALLLLATAASAEEPVTVTVVRATPTPRTAALGTRAVSSAPIRATTPITLAAEATYNPDVVLDIDLRRRRSRPFAIAEFRIDVDGSFTVALVQSAGDVRIDQAALAVLRAWRWRPALRQGTPYPSVVRARVAIVRD
jgi:TonB family protein